MSDSKADGSAENLTLCVLLWANEGMAGALAEYEDQVLALLPDHGARVVNRVRTRGVPPEPNEVHLLEFSNQVTLDEYMNDRRRLALADQREQAIARTEILRVTPVGAPSRG